MIESNKKKYSEIGTIYFVHKHLTEEWPDLIGNDNPGVSSDYLERYKNGRDDWIIKTYLELLNRGNDVSLSDHFVRGKICVAHRDHVVGVREAARSYVVSIKADRGITYTCENQIVQSPSSLTQRGDYYIPFWPQSNMIPRDKNRSSTIVNMAFMGEERNLAVRFRDKEFQNVLLKLGVHFRLAGRSNWHDYHDIDLILAIRDGAEYYLASKPASKLVNAWIAGVPAIVGSEPAYGALRRSELDYFKAETQENVLSIVKMLKGSPDLYNDMVRNGLARSTEFSFDNICSQWEQVLFHEIVPSYHKWQKKQKMLWGYYPIILYWGRNIYRLLFSRRYSRGYDSTGERLTFIYRIKKKINGLFGRR